MNTITIWENNANMEFIALIFIVLLYFFNQVLCPKRTFTKSVNYLQLCVILLMIVQIPQWYLEIAVRTGKESLLIWTALKSLYCADYALVCLFLVTFYYYLTDYISYWRKKQGDTRQFSKRGLRFRLIWGSILIIIYIVGTATDSMTFDLPSGRIGGTMLYHVLLAGLVLTSVLNVITILRNRNVLPSIDTLLLLIHVLLPSPLILLDLIHTTCYGYIGMVVSVYIVFQGVDLRQSERLLEQETLVARQQEELTRQKTQIMMTQIQPHFLYNTLSTIIYFCDKDPQQAKKILVYFSRYLRGNMDSINTDGLIPFERELKHIACYLWIEQLRYADRLRVEYDIQCTDFDLPALSVQPIVENAVYHGARSRNEGGTVTIATRREGDTVFISVRDTGTGFDPEQVKNDGKQHIGLQNITSRLKSLCGADVIIDSGAAGTNITIRMEARSNENHNRG